MNLVLLLLTVVQAESKATASHICDYFRSELQVESKPLFIT
jgi:hypothetical protein